MRLLSRLVSQTHGKAGHRKTLNPTGNICCTIAWGQSGIPCFNEHRQNKLWWKCRSLNTGNKTQTDTLPSLVGNTMGKDLETWLWRSCWGEELWVLSASSSSNSTVRPSGRRDRFLIDITVLLLSRSILWKQLPYLQLSVRVNEVEYWCS